MRKRARKITLSRETLRDLNNHDLYAVVVAAGTSGQAGPGCKSEPPNCDLTVQGSCKCPTTTTNGDQPIP